MNAPDTPPRKLLILDLDETLVHAREHPLAPTGHFRVGPYFVHPRPHLAEFVASVSACYALAVWTASSEAYAREVVARIFPDVALEFVWASSRCTIVLDLMTGRPTVRKHLAKVKRQGWRLESVLAVDDTPDKYARSYGNLVSVKAFVGDEGDAELPHLARYLTTLAAAPNVRQVEKRYWRRPRDGEPGRQAGDWSR